MDPRRENQRGCILGEGDVKASQKNQKNFSFKEALQHKGEHKGEGAETDWNPQKETEPREVSKLSQHHPVPTHGKIFAMVAG